MQSKIIELISSSGTPYQIKLNLKEEWSRYWEQEKAEQLFKAIVQQLATDVVNQPYVDNPHMKEEIWGKTVWRPNHDVAHSLRPMTYTRALLHTVKVHGSSSAQTAANSLTTQEYQAVLLASFLFRSGRTNEDSSSAGTTQNLRSAAIYREVALSLGFDEALVNSIAWCMEHYSPANARETAERIPFSGFTGATSEEQHSKAMLVNGLLLLGHNTDLVRCWSNVEDIHLGNRDNLGVFFPADKVGRIESLLLDCARSACVWTGTDFYTHENDSDTMFRSPPVYKRQAAIDTDGSLRLLEGLFENWQDVFKDLDVEKGHALMKAASALELPGKFTLTQQLQKTHLAKNAARRMKQWIGVNPYVQSPHSVTALRRELLKGEDITEGEHIGVDGLTDDERVLYDYLIKKFPWKLKHATGSMPAILHSGFIRSTDDLQRSNIELSYTPEQSGATGFTFFSAGDSSANIAEFLLGNRDVLELNLTDYMNEKGRPTGALAQLVTVSSPYGYLMQEQKEIMINGNRLKTECFSQTDRAVHPRDKKIYTVIRPDGSQRVLKTELKDEIAAGADVLPYQALKVIQMLRLIGGETRQICLANPQSEMVTSVVNSLHNDKNRELLIPVRLPIHDHRIQVQEARENLELKQSQIKAVKEALDISQPVSVLEHLLDGGVPVELDLGSGHTPLFWAMTLDHGSPVHSGSTSLFEKMALLINRGASLTRQVNGQSIFSYAAYMQHYMLVHMMLKRSITNGDQINVNGDVEAVCQALLKNDELILSLMERHGLNYGALTYHVFYLLSEQSELYLLKFLDRLEFSKFPFQELSARNQYYSCALIEKLLIHNKYTLLQRLIDKGILDVAMKSDRFNDGIIARLKACEQIRIPEALTLNGVKSRQVHLYLKTEDGQLLLVKAHHHRKAVPYWHGISGQISGAINEESISGLCLAKIGYRPQIASFTVTDAADGNSCAVIVQLKANSLPQVFQTQSVAFGLCQSLQAWQTDKSLSDLTAQVVAESEAVAHGLNHFNLLSQAAANGQGNAVHELMEQGIYHPDEQVFAAILDKSPVDIELVRAMLKRGYSPNQTVTIGNETYTPLMIAILHHNVPLMHCLLEHGGDPNQKVGTAGISLLMFAAEQNNLQVLQCLHEWGVDFRHAAHNGILAYALMKRCSEEVFQFLVARCELNVLWGGWTPLMVAAKMKDDARIKTLLDAGARWDIIQPSRLETARDMYRDCPHFFHTLSVKKHWYLDYKGYLKITGHDSAVDLEERILREYQVTLITPEISPVLFAMEQKIRERLRLPAELQLAIADDGYHEAFVCEGIQRPVISLQRNFLNHPQCTPEAILYSIALQYKIYQNRTGLFWWPNLEQLQQYDEEVRKELNLPVSTAINALQIAHEISLYPHHRAVIPFVWPVQVYADNVNMQQAAGCYLDRIKKMQRDSLASEVTIHPQSPLDMNMKVVCDGVNALPLIRYFNDFPSTEASDRYYSWFLSQLNDLAREDLLPYEATGYMDDNLASLKVKQYVQLLVTHQAALSTEQKDELLRRAFDLKIPAYEELHLALNPGAMFIKPDYPVGGYLKDMYQACDAFIKAASYDEAKSIAQRVMALHDILFPVLRNPSIDIQAEYKVALQSEQPVRRFMSQRHISYNADMITKDVREAVSQKMSEWITKEFKDQGTLGTMWRALWVTGCWDGITGYDLLSNEQKLRLNHLESRDRAIQPDDFLGLIFGWSYNLYQEYAAHHLNQQAVIANNAFALTNEEEIEQFVTQNGIQLHKDERSPDFAAAEVLRANLFQILNRVAARDDSGKQFVRNILLMDSSPLYKKADWGKIFFFRYMVMQTFFTLDEKIAYFKKCFLTGANLPNIAAFFPEEQEDEQQEHFFMLLREFSSLHRMLPVVLSHYASQIKPLSVTSRTLYQIFDFINQLKVHNDSARIGTIAKPWLDQILWNLFDDHALSAFELTRLYRILDTLFAFPDWNTSRMFGDVILSRLRETNDFVGQQASFMNLLSIKAKYGELRGHDNQLIHDALGLLAEHSAHYFGVDDHSIAYSNKVKHFIRVWQEHLPLNDFREFLAVFAPGIKTQSALCQWIDKECLKSTVISEDATAVLSRVLDVIAHDEKDKYTFLDFLSTAVSQDSLKTAVILIRGNSRLFDVVERTKMKDRTGAVTVNDSDIEYWLQTLHQNFWTFSIPQRAVAIDSLICPLSAERLDAEKQVIYEKNLNYILDKLFADEPNTADTVIARDLLISYLQTAGEEERQYLLAALVSARKQSEGVRTTLGQKLAILFEQMGPAYIKLAQAIHSHPDAPEGLREDLKTVKGHAAPPYRWDLIRQMQETLPVELWSQIATIGDVLGSASYHIAISCKLMNGSSCVVLLTRPNAERDAKKGFQHIERTFTACPNPTVGKIRSTLLNMVEQGRLMSEYELSYQIGDEQFDLAHKLYPETLVVNYREQQYQVRFSPCQSYVSGANYRILEEVEGISFNRLPQDTPEQIHLRRVVAIAVLQKELKLILSGGCFDCDRHGEQLKVSIAPDGVIHLGLFDFGEMGLEELSSREMQQVAVFLTALPKALKNNQSITGVMEEHINLAVRQGKSYNHLIRMQKAFLALQDYVRVLEPELTMADMLKQVLPEINPDYRRALKSGYMQSLSWTETGLLFFRTAASSGLGMMEGILGKRRQPGSVSDRLNY